MIISKIILSTAGLTVELSHSLTATFNHVKPMKGVNRCFIKTSGEICRATTCSTVPVGPRVFCRGKTLA